MHKKTHLICNDCNLELVERINSNANPNNALRNCLLCNSIPPEHNWRKKFTWDVEALEFTVEPAPLIALPSPPTPTNESEDEPHLPFLVKVMFFTGLPLGALIGTLINPSGESAAFGAVIGYMAPP